MTGEVAIREQGSALVVAGDEFTEAQVAALRQLGVEKASKGDLQVFHHVCQRTGLDPFARQIYLIERQGKQTIQTGIDGMRLVARRAVDASGESLEFGDPEWCDQEGSWTDVWLADGPPAAARVAVFRNGKRFPGIALYREYVQTFWKNGQEQVTAMWANRPAGQLAKCAEALALRKAFPQDLSGIYTDDEMARHDVVRGEATEARTVTAADLRGDGPSPMTAAQNQRIGALMTQLNLTEEAFQLEYVADAVGRKISGPGDLTADDAEAVIASLERDTEPIEDTEDQVAANDPALDKS